MTARQVQVFRLVVCGGQRMRAVARRLKVSHTTVRRELEHVLDRLALLGIQVTCPAGSSAQRLMTTNWDTESWGF